jgi:hypothetical protein
MFARWDGWRLTGQGGGRRIELKPLGPGVILRVAER